MAASRTFDPAFLEKATIPTINLIEQATSASKFEELSELFNQFYVETQMMLYGYIVWPKTIYKEVKAYSSENDWHSISTFAIEKLKAPVPDFKECLTKWNNYKTTLSNAARDQDPDVILELSKTWYRSALQAHDITMNYSAILLSEVGRRFGYPRMQSILKIIMSPEAMEMSPEQPFEDRVRTLIKFTRLHLLPFKIVEDDEKVTFIPSPCPSGGRQILAGLYDEGEAGLMVSGKSALTYGLEALPSYCCHEPVLEQASIDMYGAPIFVVDPASELGKKPCHIHVYKDPKDIPDHYFQRIEREKSIIARG